MAWLFGTAVLGLVVLLAFTFWGANIILHDPARKPQSVWPDQFGLRYEPEEFQNKDGQNLKAWLVHPAHPRTPPKLIVACHGWGDNKGYILPWTKFLAEKGGYHLFYFDFRACGESEGKVSTLGYLEGYDFEAAMDHLKRRHPELMHKIGAYGLSMGGSVVLTCATRYSEIKAAAIEGAFTSANDVITRWNKARTPFPDFPFVTLVKAWMRLRLGADPEPASPIYHMSKLTDLAALYVVGDQDWLMPVSEARILYDKTPGPKDLWIVPGGDHARCWHVAPEEYERRFLAFYDKYL